MQLEIRCQSSLCMRRRHQDPSVVPTLLKLAPDLVFKRDGNGRLPIDDAVQSSNLEVWLPFKR
jgi:hypothetical protein